MDPTDDKPYSVSLNFYKLYSDVFYKTHKYIVNNLNTNHEIKHIYDEPTLSEQQYLNIMSFLHEIE